jgi:hypothetical protein
VRDSREGVKVRTGRIALTQPDIPRKLAGAYLIYAPFLLVAAIVGHLSFFLYKQFKLNKFMIYSGAIAIVHPSPLRRQTCYTIQIIKASQCKERYEKKKKLLAEFHITQVKY